ncbi:hypothetical protein [Methylobacterium symbioticum]|uniref:DUF2946 domain-containing protein n=1 Tax=Methylobacterium symbioticum TaxID=2584084 RepID=A0A509ELN6_9HYPH|nr:hypothetical protein [Methylobacterium symbioticum]VUD75090.1 hypothetical protein MET9862_05730 [Methylobacterium symbioticum]
MVRLRQRWDGYASGVWRRALVCLLAIALTVSLVDPALTAPASPDEEAGGPGIVIVLDAISGAPAADEPADRGLAGPGRCSAHCPCHAVIRPESPVVTPLRIARPPEFPLGTARLSSVASTPPSEPPRA